MIVIFFYQTILRRFRDIPYVAESAVKPRGSRYTQVYNYTIHPKNLNFTVELIVYIIKLKKKKKAIINLQVIAIYFTLLCLWIDKNKYKNLLLNYTLRWLFF